MMYKHGLENMLELWHVDLICTAEVTRADLPSTKGGLLQAVQKWPSKYIHDCEKNLSAKYFFEVFI